MLERAESYEALTRDFGWRVPKRYNIGVDVCDKWAGETGRLALIHKRADGRVERFTFAELKRLSDKLANALRAAGLSRSERIGILLPQAPETALAHVAAYKLGCIAVPLFTLFGPEALEYRLKDSGAKALVTDGEGLVKLAELRERRESLMMRVDALAAHRDALRMGGAAVPAAPAGGLEDVATMPEVAPLDPSLPSTLAETARQLADEGAMLRRIDQQIAARSRALPLYERTLATDGFTHELRGQRDHPVHALLRRMYHEKLRAK